MYVRGITNTVGDVSPPIGVKKSIRSIRSGACTLPSSPQPMPSPALALPMCSSTLRMPLCVRK